MGVRGVGVPSFCVSGFGVSSFGVSVCVFHFRIEVGGEGELGGRKVYDLKTPIYLF